MISHNSLYINVGNVACVKTRKHKKIRYGQTVRVKNITGTTITVIPDSDVDTKPCFIEAKDLHNSHMTYL